MTKLTDAGAAVLAEFESARKAQMNRRSHACPARCNASPQCEGLNVRAPPKSDLRPAVKEDHQWATCRSGLPVVRRVAWRVESGVLSAKAVAIERSCR